MLYHSNMLRLHLALSKRFWKAFAPDRRRDKSALHCEPSFGSSPEMLGYMRVVGRMVAVNSWLTTPDCRSTLCIRGLGHLWRCELEIATRG